MIGNTNKKETWLMKQTWEHLLFLHWPVSSSFLESIVPFPLKADRFDGAGWIGLVPFRTSHMRMNRFPEVPLLSKMNEINLRTYVTYKGEPGVYFFSLDANHLPSVLMARSFFHLPYLNASVSLKNEKSIWHLNAQRKHRGAFPGHLEMNYYPNGDVYFSKKDTIESWLTERYTLFNPMGGHLYKGELKHRSWPLQPAECEVIQDTLATYYRRPKKSDNWLVHYSETMEAKLVNYRKIY